MNIQAVYRFKNNLEGDNGHYESLVCHCNNEESCPHCFGNGYRTVFNRNIHGDELKGFEIDNLFVPFINRD